MINEHDSSREIIKPLLRGEDLRPWYFTENGYYLILAKQGIDIDSYPAIKNHLNKHKIALSKRSDSKDGQCEWYELRPCDYYDEFDKPKIFWAEIAKLPRFAWSSQEHYSNNKVHLVVPSGWHFLAILNSRISWFFISQTAVPLRLRAGLWQYQLTKQFIKRLPIPELRDSQEKELADYAEEISTLARDRYQTHEAFRHRILSDLGTDENPLNTKLSAWWDIPNFKSFNTEIKNSFKRDIPVGEERNDWEKYLLAEQAKHRDFTEKIIAREIKLNAVVYDAFNLNAEERVLIEKASKYPYGAV